MVRPPADRDLKHDPPVGINESVRQGCRDIPEGGCIMLTLSFASLTRRRQGPFRVTRSHSVSIQSCMPDRP